MSTYSNHLGKDILTSIQLERQVLASLLAHPDAYYEIEHFLSEKDFVNSFHGACYSLIKSALDKKEKIDNVILSQRLINIGLTKFEELDTFSYIESLTYTKVVSKEITIEYCTELHKLNKLRQLYEQSVNTQKFILENRDKKLDEIFSHVDRINNSMISQHQSQSKLVNIFDNIRDFVEARADNPLQNFLMGPFPTINKIYGTLLPPACINLIGARSGVSKTALSMFYLLHLAEKYDLPILHLDFSEMTLEQLRFRAVSSFTRGVVPYHALVRGIWRDNPKWAALVNSVWNKTKKLKMYHYDIGSMHQKEIISLIRRVYYRDIGRGNTLLLNYDYLKPFDSDNHHTPEWKLMGHFIQEYKSLVNNEIPEIRGWFSLQVNRTGITNNKSANQVDDSENSFSISDRVIQQATSAFLIRRKTYDEISDEGNLFGNLKAIPLKFREILGDEWKRHFNKVQMPDGRFRDNYINLDMNSFYFEDKGDLNDMVQYMRNQIDVSDNSEIERPL